MKLQAVFDEAGVADVRVIEAEPGLTVEARLLNTMTGQSDVLLAKVNESGEARFNTSKFDNSISPKIRVLGTHGDDSTVYSLVFDKNQSSATKFVYVQPSLVGSAPPPTPSYDYDAGN
jgi:hypothetical protein